MHALVIEVNMGTKNNPTWNKLNSVLFDPNALKRIWNPGDGGYVECHSTAKNLCHKHIGAWSLYQRYLGRQFRIMVDELRGKHHPRKVLAVTSYSED